MSVLAADIGGTHTRLCLAEKQAKQVHLIYEQVYASQQYPDFISIVKSFLSDTNLPRPDAACFAVAGPVRAQQAQVTNLPWQLDAVQLKKELAITTLSLINDFQAVGYGLEMLNDDQLVSLQPGQPEKLGRRALIGAGTGLGISSLVYQKHAYVPYPSEGGHTGFAPANDVQGRLLHYLQASLDYVGYEHILSGSGLQRLYQFFLDENGTDSEFTKDIFQALDPAVEITRHAKDKDDLLAVQTLDCFIQIYGAQAGNVALNYLPTGGLYIAGGIAPKIIKLLNSERFITAFHHKGVMTELMQGFPIKVIMEEKVGLLGAATFACRE